MNYPAIIGGYFRILGWVSLAGLILSVALVYWTDSLYLDFSFVIWLWLGAALKRANPTARKWAIGIGVVVTVLISLILLFGGGHARCDSLRFGPENIWYYLEGLLGFLLLG